MSAERSRPASPIPTRIILYVVLALLYLPVVVMVFDSLRFEGALSFKWYADVFASRELFPALQRSLFVGLTASLLATVLGSFASIGLMRSRGRVNQLLESFSYVSLVVPELVFALGLLSWFFILKVPLSLTTVIISHVTFSISFVLMTVNGRAASFDRAIEDAGRDLGAGEWLILFKITIPLLLPAIVSGFLLAFLLSFDDFLISFYTSGVGSDTLPIRLYAAMRAGLSPKLSALATLMLFISIGVILLLIHVRGLKFDEEK